VEEEGRIEAEKPPLMQRLFKGVDTKGRIEAKKPEKPPAKKGKRVLHITLFFLVFFIAVYIFLQPKIQKGMPAPDFTLPDLEGRSITLSQFKGKIVFLNFWATWCPPCIEEIPSINKLNEKISRDDFVILAVNIDQTGMDNIREFAKSKGMKFPVLLDPKSHVAAGKYGITGVPETFLIDRNGIIIERYIGPRNWNEEEFIKYLNTIFDSGK
jgi:peroxiredoxin